MYNHVDDHWEIPKLREANLRKPGLFNVRIFVLRNLVKLTKVIRHVLKRITPNVPHRTVHYYRKEVKNPRHCT